MSVTAADNSEFIRSYFAEMRATSGRQDVIERFVSDEMLKQHIRWARSVAPDYEVVAEQMVSEGDTVAVRGKVNGIQRGEFKGIAPTGKQFSVDVAIFYRVKDGKIVDHWMLFDALGAINQLKA
jgi:predicted ester cyclase